jgi:hypothetical protein
VFTPLSQLSYGHGPGIAGATGLAGNLLLLDADEPPRHPSEKGVRDALADPPAAFLPSATTAISWRLHQRVLVMEDGAMREVF